MSWQEAVSEVADDMQRLFDGATCDQEQHWSLFAPMIKQLRLIVKSARDAPAPPLQRGAVDTLQAERVLKKLSEAEELRSSSQAMRLCVGGSLDGTYIPSGGVEVGKPVKSPINGERYVLQEDGFMHFCETP